MRDDPKFLARLREEHERRKQELELRAARFGIDAPPELAIEIEQINNTLRALDSKDRPYLTSEAAEAFGWRDMLDRVMKIEDKLDDRLDELVALSAKVSMLISFRAMLMIGLGLSLASAIVAIVLLSIHIMASG